MTTLERLGQLDIRINAIGHDGLIWYDLEKPGDPEIRFLAEHFPFHPLDLEDTVGRVQLPKLDAYPDYVFVVLHFPLFNTSARITRPSQVAVFAGQDYVVTVHNGELRPLHAFFAECESSPQARAEHMGSGSGFLLYCLFERLVRYGFPMLSKLIGNVDALESRLLDGRASRSLRELAYVRRDILSYRRVIRPQIDVIETMESGEFPFLHLDADVYFGDLADQFRRIWVELEELKEVTEGLQDAHMAVTTEHTNEVVRVLTLFAAVLLPLSLIAGLYGMNVPLPGGSESWTLWVLAGVMVTIAAGLLAVFRRRGLF